MTIEIKKEHCREFLKLMLKECVEHQKPPRNKDTIFLLTGSEGSGKSYFMMYALELIAEIKKKKIEGKQITGNIRDFLILLKHSPKAYEIALDEGGELASTEQMNKLNKKMTQVFRAIREKSFITFICFTNPLKINTYFREDRARGVFFIPKNGEIRYFNRMTFTNKVLPDIMDNKLRSIDNFKKYKPDFRFNNFPLYDGYLKKEYKKFKQQTMNDIIDSAILDVDNDNRGWYNLSEASKTLNISRAYIYTMIKNGEINCEIHPITKRQYIKEEDIQILLNKMKDSKLINNVHTNNNNIPINQ